MSDRPTTSSGRRRPPTASASVAHSSTLAHSPPGAFDHDRHQHYDNAAFFEEEEEESDAEDLFAFLPPSTADQQREFEKQRAADHFRRPSDYSSIFANAVPQSGPPAYPMPVFTPPSRFLSDTPGPSSLFHPPVSNLPVESPPSTASQQGTSDPYRMQRLGTARTGTAETRPSISIREIHVNLPSSIQEKDVDVGYTESLQRKRHPSSTIADTATLSLTPSMLEQDSREGSIK